MIRIICWSPFRDEMTPGKLLWYPWKLGDITVLTTGWSKKTVTSNFFLTEQKFQKVQKTNDFYGAYPGRFWYFDISSVKCVEFCLPKLFQHKALGVPYKACTLRYTLRCTKTLHTSMNSAQIPFEKLLRHPPHISRQHDTLTDTIRHHQTPNDTTKCHGWILSKAAI